MRSNVVSLDGFRYKISLASWQPPSQSKKRHINHHRVAFVLTGWSRADVFAFIHHYFLHEPFRLTELQKEYNVSGVNR